MEFSEEFLILFFKAGACGYRVTKNLSTRKTANEMKSFNKTHADCQRNAVIQQNVRTFMRNI